MQAPFVRSGCACNSARLIGSNVTHAGAAGPGTVLWSSARLLGMPRDGKTQPPSTGRSHPAGDPVYWSSLVV